MTSDCRPWPGNIRLAVCGRCAVVQKIADAGWRARSARVYKDYRLYHQYGGQEQRLFASSTGASAARSEKLTDYLKDRAGLSASGDLLEIGCGEGAFLRAFGSRFPRWRMSGMDLDARCRTKVLKIRNAVRFYRTLTDVRGQFDRIVLIHTLEHIPGPLDLLKELVPRLKPGGGILVQVPDLEENPFDMAVVDHVSHFTRASLAGLFRMAGYRDASIASWVPKELTVMAHPGTSVGSLKHRTDPARQARIAEKGMRFLEYFLSRSRASMRRRYGVFGTSIAAAWLCSAARKKPDFFVDESAGASGRYLGRRVLKPSEVDADARVIVPMPPKQAVGLVRRLRSAGIGWSFCLPLGGSR